MIRTIHKIISRFPIVFRAAHDYSPLLQTVSTLSLNYLHRLSLSFTAFCFAALQITDVPFVPAFFLPEFSLLHIFISPPRAMLYIRSSPKRNVRARCKLVYD